MVVLSQHVNVPCSIETLCIHVYRQYNNCCAKFWNYDVERTRAFHLWLLRTSKLLLLLLLSNTKVLKSLVNNQHIRTPFPTNGFAMIIILCLSLVVFVSFTFTCTYARLRQRWKYSNRKTIWRRSLFTPILCKHIITTIIRSSGSAVLIVT